MESRKSVQNLANSIRSLLGLNTHLTSSWANSVCSIIKDLTPEEPDNGSQIKSPDFNNAGSIVNKDVDLGDSVSKIQGDLAALNAHLNHLNLQRRQALNDFLDLKGKIRVFCRIRPIIEGEKFGPQGPIVASYSNNVLLKLAENKSKCYIFDKVFHPSSSQDEVFSEVGQVIKSALDGYNVCIFAYGQTGTGKTFTMEGTPGSPGVVPRAMEALFKQAVDSNHKFLFTFSMLEIYMGNLRDLLVPQATKPTDPMPKCLSIQTDSNGEIEIDNLVAIQVSEFNQVLKLYRLGSRFRSTASTYSNATSSRSHCLIRISLTCFDDASERRRETNKIWMVDLGGSERVLKTKSCGRRFEEGKAINLSLSALGDVISALQRRKSHIPYRNSKLTQVLKDSLGEDSKTLMLVHVSPKEEDLCETVCSLGFATRVRSVQLGNEESPEIRANKEVAMMKLLQKVKQLECEREDIRRDIEKLNERLKDLLGTVPSSNEHLEAPHPSSELLHSTVEMEKHSIGYVKAPSQPPSFMRPTVSSRRKSGIDYQSSESVQKKYPRSARRKRPSSLRAESVTFPIKDVSEYGSECSTSRTSCLVDLNMKHSADYETEYSLDASECDIKVVVFPEQEKSPRSLTRSKTLGYGNRKANKIDSTKFLKIDHWFRRQKDESTSRTNTHRSHWMPAIPVPEKKNRRNEQNEAEILHKEKANNHGFTKKKISNHDKIEKLAGIGVLGRSIAEVVTGETQNLLDDFVSEDSGSNPISLCQKTKDRSIEETQLVLDNFANNDNGHGPIHPPNTEGDRVKQGINYGRVIGTFVKQEVMEEKQNSLKDFLLKESGCNLFSPSDMGSSIINQNYESHVPVSKSELESKSQMFPTETLNEVIVGSKSTNMIDEKVKTEDLISNGNTSEEDSEKADLFGSPQYIEAVTRPCLDTMKSRRALFIDRKEEDREDTMTVIGSQVNIQNTGIFHLLEQKVRTLFASALLGSGIQNLGLGHDFFDGLIL